MSLCYGQIATLFPNECLSIICKQNTNKIQNKTETKLFLLQVITIAKFKGKHNFLFALSIL